MQPVECQKCTRRNDASSRVDASVQLAAATDGHLPDNSTEERPRLEVLRILWMRIFKELLLRRDFSQHSGRFSGSKYRSSEERQQRASECLSGASVNCVSSGLQLSMSSLFFSFLFFSPVFYEGLHLGGGVFRGRRGGCCERVRETGSRRGFPTKAAQPP